MRVQVLTRLASGLLTASGSLAHASPGLVDELIKEGQELVRLGNVDEGCAKFEESLTLEPSIRTRMNLADCRMRQQRFTAAYRMFELLALEADRLGKPDQAKVARDYQRVLAGKLVRIRIRIAEPDVAGLTITVASSSGTTEIPRAEWSEPVIADPGQVTIRATAPEHEPFQIREIRGEGAELGVTVPALVRVAPFEPPREAPRSKWPLILGATGGVFVLGSLGLGMSAKLTYDDAAMLPPDLDRVEVAQRRADIGTVVGIVGLVGIGASVLLYLRDRDRVMIVPAADGTSVGVVAVAPF